MKAGMKGYLTKALKAAIKEGGVIIAPRMSGKTHAIVELLREQPWKDLYNIPHKEFWTCICHSNQSAHQMRKNFPDQACKIYGPTVKNPGKVILDEYLWNPYKGEFHAAISSNKETMVIYNKTGRRVKIKVDERLE